MRKNIKLTSYAFLGGSTGFGGLRSIESFDFKIYVRHVLIWSWGHMCLKIAEP